MSNSSAAGSAGASRRLYDICCETFEKFRADYLDLEGHEMNYGLIADLGPHYKGLFIAVFGREEFHPEHETMETLTIQGCTYDILGTIVGGQAYFSCEKERLTSFFTTSGQAMVNPARVHDKIKDRKADALGALGQQRQGEKKDAKAAKKIRREAEQAASPSQASGGNQVDRSQVGDELMEEKPLSKSQKRRAKKTRPVQRRKQEEQKMAEREQLQAIQEAVEARLRAEGKGDAEVTVYNAATEEGRESIRRLQESGEGALFKFEMPDSEY
ncbi:Hypothetical predicted protein [Lecanosticta acicola]|uniref:Uncharacterized protein n=1 Tax=Lecanosticta acicola TaxID=111012 RepID=A0AAI8Z7R2_9PEZI|nr:Hypothetical predicted protein [Lecanosticta acicola]